MVGSGCYKFNTQAYGGNGERIVVARCVSMAGSGCYKFNTQAYGNGERLLLQDV